MAENLNYENLSHTEEEELKSEYSKNGVTGCLEYLKKMSTQWKTVPLKVGIIGSTGVGKSSFINAVRGLLSEDEGAAAVDVVETTKNPTKYSHPDNVKLEFWDLPGVGTPKFLKDNYLKDIDVDTYDYFIIMTAVRFTENDVWLAREIVNRKKNFYFVRTKIGVDVLNDKYEKRSKHSEINVLQKIRNITSKQLKEEGFTDQHVFLIDNHMREKYDFDELERTIITDLPELKRQAMILSLSVYTFKMIKIKAEELRKRVWTAALKSATVAAIPIPGVSILFDAGLLTTEMKFYYQQLGLDDASLKRRAQLMNIEYDVLVAVVRRDFPQDIGIQLIKSLVATGGYVVGMALEEGTKFIPVVGSIIAAPISFAFTKFALNYKLNRMEETSLELTNYFSAQEHADE